MSDKGYTFEDLVEEITKEDKETNRSNVNGIHIDMTIYVLANKIVELTNRVIELENKHP